MGIVGHEHGPSSSAAMAHRGKLVAVLVLTSLVLVVEVAGAYLSGSLALLADAGHMLTDVAGIVLAVLAVTLAARPPTDRRTFGYYRLEILAAVVNAVLLVGVATYILFEAWQRWREPPEVHSGLMLAFAAVGLVSNGVGLWLLRPGAQESLNIKGAYLEVLGDTFGSVAVIGAAVVIAVTGWQRADVVASVLVAVLIVPRAFVLLREVTDVLLQGTPSGMELAEVRQHIVETPGVVDAHDLHVWTLTSGMPVLSVHVVVEEQITREGTGGELLDRLGACLRDHFDVDHSTIQLEPEGHADHEGAVHT